MNLVFVNSSDPTVSHVSSTRSWRFAEELAKKGHRVLQISEDVDSPCSKISDSRLNMLMEKPGMANPQLLKVGHDRSLLYRWATSENWLQRKLGITLGYGLKGSIRCGWPHAARRGFRVIAAHFRPDVVWGIFGNTDCWVVARDLAREAGCHWVADFKDPFSLMVPCGLRRMVANKFRSAASSTANSVFNLKMNDRYMRGTRRVVYSGVDSCFEPIRSVVVEKESWFTLTITGSVYSKDRLQDLVKSIYDLTIENGWPGSGRRLRIVYAGPNQAIARDVLNNLGGRIAVEINGYLPVSKLAELCKQSSVNCYISSSRTFHHKLLELLACAVPVLAYPGEMMESIGLASEVGGCLLAPQNKVELRQSLIDAASKSHRRRVGHEGQSLPFNFYWKHQADKLESVFLSLALHKS